ncbi:helix-turn-helix transcriptional regulator [Flavonifractor sp. AGMB03687]|uniref:helix-turn-helix domain-containing protein n=1 Tax=Flavonifractor sp. AGMB03687 TaxID=2785133 RepID=UPI001ADFB662|nr:helix-turn-helix transcriptional regulator [Flavonifractor sp. AGMB03687]
MEIGKRIMELREAAGWTTNRLANLCGLSQSFLRSVELGEKGISVENLQLICDTLHISLRDFFDVPSDQDTEQERLLRQIAKLTDEQKLALISFLETMSK